MKLIYILFLAFYSCNLMPMASEHYLLDHYKTMYKKYKEFHSQDELEVLIYHCFYLEELIDQAGMVCFPDLRVQLYGYIAKRLIKFNRNIKNTCHHTQHYIQRKYNKLARKFHNTFKDLPVSSFFS